MRRGPLVELAQDNEVWLDGGHNLAAGAALNEALARLPEKPLHLIVGMLNTKDISGYLRQLAGKAVSLQGVSIPGEPATVPAEQTVEIASTVGFEASVAQDVAAAVARIGSGDPQARILICGSLYLAGRVLRENS